MFFETVKELKLIRVGDQKINLFQNKIKRIKTTQDQVLSRTKNKKRKF